MSELYVLGLHELRFLFVVGQYLLLVVHSHLEAGLVLRGGLVGYLAVRNFPEGSGVRHWVSYLIKLTDSYYFLKLWKHLN